MPFHIGPDLIERYEDEPFGPFCAHCGDELDRAECDQCGGEGYFGYETLQEWDPLWYQPGDTEDCGQCGGDGGWWYCTNKECPGKK